MLKRMLCALLAVCLLCSLAVAEKVTLNVLNMSGGTMDLTVEFDEVCFMKSAYVYDHALMRASIAIAQASYGSADEYGATGDFARDRYALAAYEALGFSDIVSRNFDITLNDPSDKVAFLFGRRGLPDGSELILVLIRSGNYGAEWASNFNTGAGETHAGFSNSAKGVTDALKAYIDERVTAERVRIWLTGYSRAAATANLAARTLDEMSELGGEKFSPEDVFAYTFATPATVRQGMAREGDALYDNIYNVISVMDIVAEVPLSRWGYTRYGRTLEFPKLDSLAGGDELMQTYKPVIDAHKSISGVDFDILSYGALRGAVDKSLLDMAACVKTVDEYSSDWQGLFTRLMRVLNTCVNINTLDENAYKSIMSANEGQAWTTALKYERAVLNDKTWATSALTALLSIYGNAGAAALTDASVAVNALLKPGDSAYAFALTYAALGLMNARELARADGVNPYMRLGKYVPMISVLVGWTALFAGHMPNAYLAFLTTLTEDELFE